MKNLIIIVGQLSRHKLKDFLMNLYLWISKGDDPPHVNVMQHTQSVMRDNKWSLVVGSRLQSGSVQSYKCGYML